LQLSVLVASARTFGYSSVCLCMKWRCHSVADYVWV
jgi:hypothetical protein